MRDEVKSQMRARRSPVAWDSSRIRLYFMHQEGRAKSVANSLYLIPHEEHAEIPSFTTLEPQEAQQLMDDLWECGLRPSEGSGSAGAMKAVQDHLKDFKTILWHTMKIEKGDK